MKNYIHKSAVFILIIMAPLCNTHAQSSVDMLDEKFHLEKTISDRLEQILKTRLDKKHFDISVDAKIKQKTNQRLSAVPKYNAAGELNLGAIQSWYAKELTSRPFELDSVSITLILADAVTPKYREELNTWLQYWVKANFDNKGEGLIISRPADVLITNEPTSTWSKISWKNIERYQNLFGMLLLGFFYALANIIKSRSKKSTPIVVAQQSAPALQIMPAERMVASTPQLYQNQADEFKTEERIRQMKAKIAWVSPTLKKQINSLVMFWVENEAASYIKVAAFIEALAEGSASLPRNSAASMPKLPDNAHLHLPKALDLLQQMTAADTLNLYQEIYMDLLSKDLGDQEQRYVGFEFLTNLNTNELQSVFDSLSDPFQILLLTRLPKDVRLRYTQTTDLNKLRQTLNKSLTCEDPTDQQLLLELQAWQNKQAMIANGNSNLVFKIAKLRETWSEISRLEETLWMHEVLTTHPEMKERMMREEQHHLYFITEWPTEKIRKFCLQTKTGELAAAVTCLPFLADKIMDVCGEQMRKEIHDELKSLNKPKLAARFERFVAAFDAFVDSENTDIYPSLNIVKSNAS